VNLLKEAADNYWLCTTEFSYFCTKHETNKSSLCSNLLQNSNSKFDAEQVDIMRYKSWYTTRKRKYVEGGRALVYCCLYENWGKEFSRTNNMIDHVLVHQGIKPYNWCYWKKSFTQKSNMTKHMKTHLMPKLQQRKRYYWEHCVSSYTERYNYMVSDWSMLSTVNVIRSLFIIQQFLVKSSFPVWFIYHCLKIW